ncbi:hypothetical protein AGMMS49975_16200 [Clostridia bacterium]|nr:hypothetical protein AGMMS49975_16200 [Clostridia bacterium]
MGKSCERAERLMMLYMDKSLLDDEEKELRKHLSGCERCKNDFDIYVQINGELAEDAPEEFEIPRDFEILVMAKVHTLEENGFSRNIPDKDTLSFVACGIMSVLLGISYIAVLYREQITAKLSENAATAAFAATLPAVSEYSANLAKNIADGFYLFLDTSMQFVNEYQVLASVIVFIVISVQCFLYKKRRDTGRA